MRAVVASWACIWLKLTLDISTSPAPHLHQHTVVVVVAVLLLTGHCWRPDSLVVLHNPGRPDTVTSRHGRDEGGTGLETRDWGFGFIKLRLIRTGSSLTLDREQELLLLEIKEQGWRGVWSLGWHVFGAEVERSWQRSFLGGFRNISWKLFELVKHGKHEIVVFCDSAEVSDFCKMLSVGKYWLKLNGKRFY